MVGMVGKGGLASSFTGKKRGNEEKTCSGGCWTEGPE